ncbi:(2Fe-2S)-binding protein, partial [Actinoplanes sp. NPDC049599]|uniref:(2Fe-2S)-binding protein n=1 Tax=Actinoplanes sp. NPDC049599 TaxID=3363903 RepID=UPI00379DF921
MTRLPPRAPVDLRPPLSFSVNGVEYPAVEGDTVASALVAADVLKVGPSIYRGRARGLLTADLTEPNALIQADGGEVLPATVVEVTEGMKVRTLSGIGRLETEPDSAFHDKKFVHTDVLVVGGGPAGMAAALTASAGGARVLLVDDQPTLGGSLSILDEWTVDLIDAFAERPELTVLSHSSVFGYYDQNYLLVLERLPRGGRVWHVRAQQVVLATGARQRPLVFENNDR